MNVFFVRGCIIEVMGIISIAVYEWIARFWPEGATALYAHSDTICQVTVLLLFYICIRVPLGWFLEIACRFPVPVRLSIGARLRALCHLVILIFCGCLRGQRVALFVAFRALCLVGMFGLLGCVMWAFIEPYHPQVRYIEFTAPKITQPLRLVQLSDLHCDEFERAEPQLPGLLRELKPAAILFTGDGFNTERGASTFFKTIRSLREVAPVYAVRGNWEVWAFPQVEVFAPSGMISLEGTAVALPAGEGRVWLCGAEVARLGAGIDKLRTLPADEFKIFLQHFPCHWRDVDEYADLYLAGDTHGGQIRLPLLGPIGMARRVDGKMYDDGLQKPGKHVQLYVNHGYGMMGGSMPRVRFNCPPEITVIDILPPAIALAH